jgi:hypothetical protein
MQNAAFGLDGANRLQAMHGQVTSRHVLAERLDRDCREVIIQVEMNFEIGFASGIPKEDDHPLAAAQRIAEGVGTDVVPVPLGARARPSRRIGVCGRPTRARAGEVYPRRCARQQRLSVSTVDVEGSTRAVEGYPEAIIGYSRVTDRVLPR